MTKSGWRYTHYEVQNSRDPNMAHRMHGYGVQLMYNRKHPSEWWPVISIVLWPRKVPSIPEAPLRILVAEGMEIVWPFVNIKVFEWDKAKLATDAPGILILAPLVPDVTVNDLEQYAQRLYNRTEGTERETAGALLYTFVAERYQRETNWAQIRENVTLMLGKVGFGMNIIDEMILNTDIAQHAVQVAVQIATEEAEARGEARGEAKGEVKGEAKGAVKVLRRLWAKRFGALPSEVEDVLQTVASEALEHVLDQMLDPAYTVTQACSDLGL